MVCRSHERWMNGWKRPELVGALEALQKKEEEFVRLNNEKTADAISP